MFRDMWDKVYDKIGVGWCISDRVFLEEKPGREMGIEMHSNIKYLCDEGAVENLRAK